MALSATIPIDVMEKELPKALGMVNLTLISANPDRPNIFLDKQMKLPSRDIEACYEDLIIRECEALAQQRDLYPVTLIYLPHPAYVRA